jgi:hypothetical protein
MLGFPEQALQRARAAFSIANKAGQAYAIASGESLMWKARPGSYLIGAIDKQGRAVAEELKVVTTAIGEYRRRGGWGRRAGRCLPQFLLRLNTIGLGCSRLHS